MSINTINRCLYEAYVEVEVIFIEFRRPCLFGLTISCIPYSFRKSILWVNGIMYTLLSLFHGSTVSCIRYSFRKLILWVNDIMYMLLIFEVYFMGRRYHVYATHFGSQFSGSAISCICYSFRKFILWVNVSCIRYSFRKSILWVNHIMYTLLISEVYFMGQWYHVYATHFGSRFYGPTISCIRYSFQKSILLVNGHFYYIIHTLLIEL